MLVKLPEMMAHRFARVKTSWMRKLEETIFVCQCKRQFIKRQIITLTIPAYYHSFNTTYNNLFNTCTCNHLFSTCTYDHSFNTYIYDNSFNICILNQSYNTCIDDSSSNIRTYD